MLGSFFGYRSSPLLFSSSPDFQSFSLFFLFAPSFLPLFRFPCLVHIAAEQLAIADGAFWLREIHLEAGACIAAHDCF
jgi:hypothetical protein